MNLTIHASEDQVEGNIMAAILGAFLSIRECASRGSLDLCAFVVSSKKDFLQSDNT